MKAWIHPDVSQRFWLVVVVYVVGEVLAHFGSLRTNWALSLNATVYLSIVADHIHPFITTVYPSSDVLPAG